MEKGGKPATQWLNNKGCTLPACVVDTTDGHNARSRTSREALQVVRDFWRRTWRSPRSSRTLDTLEAKWRQAEAVPPLGSSHGQDHSGGVARAG